MSVELLVAIISQLMKLGGIVFFMYAAYQGTFGGEGSTSVFIGTGVLALVIIGSMLVERIGRI